MDLVFTTKGVEPSKRYAAWQGAICDVYVNVDVNAEKRPTIMALSARRGSAP